MCMPVCVWLCVCVCVCVGVCVVCACVCVLVWMLGVRVGSGLEWSGGRVGRVGWDGGDWVQPFCPPICLLVSDTFFFHPLLTGLGLV